MSNQRAHLPEDLYNMILDYCECADACADRDDIDAAFIAYNQAYQLIPAPKEKWAATIWVLSSIADLAYLTKRDEFATEVLQDVFNTFEEAGTNPFLQLRFGQVLFEQGRLSEAADHLMRAYTLEGERLFDAESPKYLAFLKTRTRID